MLEVGDREIVLYKQEACGCGGESKKVFKSQFVSKSDFNRSDFPFECFLFHIIMVCGFLIFSNNNYI